MHYMLNNTSLEIFRKFHYLMENFYFNNEDLNLSSTELKSIKSSYNDACLEFFKLHADIMKIYAEYENLPDYTFEFINIYAISCHDILRKHMADIDRIINFIDNEEVDTEIYQVINNIKSSRIAHEFFIFANYLADTDAPKLKNNNKGSVKEHLDTANIILNSLKYLIGKITNSGPIDVAFHATKEVIDILKIKK